MIIYIYGSDSFKKEINEVLKHSNIKFRLDSHGEIKELNSIDQLKDAIEENPNNIYLIDDSKIIKKNPITDKIKFLRPKDGIEQEYLLDNGIGDVSVDSIDELSKHIIRRLDAVIKNDEDNIDDIQNSIVEIVENAYDENDNSDVVELDDELSALLSSSKEEDSFFEEDTKEELSPEEEIKALLSQVEEANEEDFVQNKSEEIDPAADLAQLDALLGELEENDKEEISMNNEILELDKELPTEQNNLDDVLNQIEEHKINNEIMEDNKELEELKDLSFDNNLDNIKIDEVEIQENSTQGEKMADDFSEFDTLSESEILEALNDLDNVTVSGNIQETNKDEIKVEEKTNTSNVDLSESSTEDIAKLISQLLNNKTLEITIKVKE